jgi:hypothetical protein
MPGHHDAWRCEADGRVAADVGAFRLAVRTPGDARGPVRFVVLRREGGDGPHASVGSGTEPDVRAAMEKAARMADRLVEAPGTRPFLSGRCFSGKTAGAPCAS